MTGLDTNLLIRLLTRDDETQARAVENLLNQQTKPAFIDRIVTIETIWVLQRHYRYPKNQIAQAIHQLLQIPKLQLEDQAKILDALTLYTTTNADFADIMIMLGNLQNKSNPMRTFDKKAAKLPNVELLEV